MFPFGANGSEAGTNCGSILELGSPLYDLGESRVTR